GYRRALTEWGLSADPELVAEGDFTEKGGYLPMQQLIARRPEAVFVASDTMALGALRAIQEAGLVVPQDIAMVSFDDLPTAATANPPLTSVHQSPQAHGALAVETLLDIVRHGANPIRHVILPTELVIRASCGAVQAINAR
ncbi:MAG: substrate-binding domain-containing protein, partial [Anaerolineae bacterium]|nr:substrate-binding domain-containing protein [Anaerolineae bacterium]